MSNSETGVEYLEGVTAFVEDWHCFPWGKAYSMLITLQWRISLGVWGGSPAGSLGAESPSGSGAVPRKIL